MNTVYEDQVIWSQIDANLHLRHTGYADFAAHARFALMEELGLPFTVFQKLKIGPILFREESIYLREVRINDKIKVTSLLTKARPDASRWSVRHEIYRGDGVKAAIVNVDGAWIDLVQRKIAVLPQELADKFLTLPKADDFQMVTE